MLQKPSSFDISPLIKQGAFGDSSCVFSISPVETPLGQMIALSDEHALYLLVFSDQHNLLPHIRRLCHHMNASLREEVSAPIASISRELQAYFSHQLCTFTTPTIFIGTPFQQNVWKCLMAIPYGSKCSYSDMAKILNQPTAFRAIARANGSNLLSIIIPCHRVIYANGSLGGYAGGSYRKCYLLKHEQELLSSGKNQM